MDDDWGKPLEKLQSSWLNLQKSQGISNNKSLEAHVYVIGVAVVKGDVWILTFFDLLDDCVDLDVKSFCKPKGPKEIEEASLKFCCLNPSLYLSLTFNTFRLNSCFVSQIQSLVVKSHCQIHVIPSERYQKRGRNHDLIGDEIAYLGSTQPVRHSPAKAQLAAKHCYQGLAWFIAELVDKSPMTDIFYDNMYMYVYIYIYTHMLAV